MIKVKTELSRFVSFGVLNLLAEWPVRGPFDIVFCRNVMIYFDQPTRDRLIARFAQILAEGGHLCLGHSESIHDPNGPFRPVGRTIYKKVKKVAHG